MDERDKWRVIKTSLGQTSNLPTTPRKRMALRGAEGAKQSRRSRAFQTAVGDADRKRAPVPGGETWKNTRSLTWLPLTFTLPFPHPHPPGCATQHAKCQLHQSFESSPCPAPIHPGSQGPAQEDLTPAPGQPAPYAGGDTQGQGPRLAG